LPIHNLDNVETNAKNDEQHSDVDDKKVRDRVEISIDDAQEEHDMLHDDDLDDTLKLPHVSTRRSNRLINHLPSMLLMSM